VTTSAASTMSPVYRECRRRCRRDCYTRGWTV